SLHLSRSYQWYYLLLSSYGACPAPHSFPTRRSSDLPAGATRQRIERHFPVNGRPVVVIQNVANGRIEVKSKTENGLIYVEQVMRSEEHTSELQSHLKLVCRLLLEKKKTTSRHTHTVC